MTTGAEDLVRAVVAADDDTVVEEPIELGDVGLALAFFHGAGVTLVVHARDRTRLAESLRLAADRLEAVADERRTVQ